MVFSFILSALKVFAALHSIGSELQIVARLPLPSTHCMQAVCQITFCNLGFLGLQVKTTKRCVVTVDMLSKRLYVFGRVWSLLALFPMLSKLHYCSPTTLC